MVTNSLKILPRAKKALPDKSGAGQNSGPWEETNLGLSFRT
jgi:hypothetical protein